MNRRTALGAVCGLLSGAVAGCLGGPEAEVGRGGSDTSADAPGAPPTLASAAFDDGEPIPRRFTCDGADVSPGLTVATVPDAAASLALVVDDPDAPSGTFTHWLLWGLPPETATIPEGLTPGGRVEGLGGAIQGTNDAGRVGYSGPCPPAGDGPHTYRFRLIALGEPLALEPGGRRAGFDVAVEGVARSASVLRGTYER